MKQLIPFDPAKGGKEAGKCLKNTRLGYGIPAKYSNAITAWLNTEQHKDRNFPALDIPIYFSYKEDGHIGNRFANGQFWSDGKTYSSLEAYEKNHAPKFLGWGESVNNVKVIGGSMQDTADNYFVQACAEGLLGRTAAGDKNLLNNVGRPKTDVLDTIRFYPEAVEFRRKAMDYDRLRKEFEDYKSANPNNLVPYTGEQLFVKAK